MLSIEIKVNGQPVGIVSAYRGEMSGPITFQEELQFHYPYQATFFPLALKGEPQVFTGDVTHFYKDGMAKLAAKILSDIAENSPPIP